MVVKVSESNIPPTSIAPTTMPIFISSEVDTISGSAPLIAASTAPSIMLATRPAQKPCFREVRMKGRII